MKLCQLQSCYTDEGKGQEKMRTPAVLSRSTQTSPFIVMFHNMALARWSHKAPKVAVLKGSKLFGGTLPGASGASEGVSSNEFNQLLQWAFEIVMKCWFISCCCKRLKKACKKVKETEGPVISKHCICFHSLLTLTASNFLSQPVTQSVPI